MIQHSHRIYTYFQAIYYSYCFHEYIHKWGNTVGFAKCQTYSAVTWDGMKKLMVKINKTNEVSKINYSKNFFGAVSTKGKSFYELCSWSWSNKKSSLSLNFIMVHRLKVKHQFDKWMKLPSWSTDMKFSMMLQCFYHWFFLVMIL